MRGHVLALFGALVCLAGGPGDALATMDATTECLSGFEGVPEALIDGGTLECLDCDPCDSDGVLNGSCTFNVAVCLNQPRGTCTAASSLNGKVKPRRFAIVGTQQCGGNLTPVVVKTKRGGKRPGRVVLISKFVSSDRPKRVDLDRLILICNSRAAGNPCPTTTTSTPTTSLTGTTATTTTTTQPVTTTTGTTPTTTTTTTTIAGGSTTTTVTLPTTTTIPGGSTTTTVTLPTTTTTEGGSTTTTITGTTTTTIGGPQCEAIVTGQPIPNTYSILGVTGQNLCHTNTLTNKFGPCSVDADCGGTVGGCIATPFVTADGITLPFPTGVSTTFTIAAEGASPACSHNVCIGCGNPDATCAGIPGCAGAGGFGCIKSTCCDQPRFIVPTFAIPSVGQCVRVDQVACGVGVVNTSNPQTGDNEVIKQGDTSDPGPDCTYGPGDPAPKPCNSGPGGAGTDTLGKIVRTLGNSSPDSAGIHYRFLTPMMATAWTGDTAGCPPGATYDGAEVGELISTQILLQAEPTTAGATGEFVDIGGMTNGMPDGCKKAGAGFSGDGPVTLGPTTLRPMPYGGGPSVAGSAGVALSGGAPLFDLGFVVVLPNAAPTIEAAETCSCTVTPGCPE